MIDSIAFTWKRIDQWFERFAPTSAHYFFPGATPSEIQEAEMALGFPLPEDLKACYQIHNGVSLNASLIDRVEGLAPLSDLVAWWDKMADLADSDSDWAEQTPQCLLEEGYQPVQPVWWHQAWLPFAGDGAGNLFCFDLAPLPGGHVGQILDWDHEVGPFRVRAASIPAFLSRYADQLEAGLRLSSGIPLIPLENLTLLAERRASFLQPSPAKPLLHEAIRKGYEALKAEDILTTYQQVLASEAATTEDRFFAYYGLFTWHLPRSGMSIALYELLERYEEEAGKMTSTHWVHQELALLKES